MNQYLGTGWPILLLKEGTHHQRESNPLRDGGGVKKVKLPLVWLLQREREPKKDDNLLS